MGPQGGEKDLLTTIEVIIAISVLIIIHELFHFLACRIRGVKVERFSVGFGPRLFGIKRGDTDYCVCAFPLGGYVKMAGETENGKRGGEKWEFLSQPVHGRAAIIAAGPLGNYVLAYIIFVIIMIMGYPALTAKIGGLQEEYPAQAAGLMEGDRIVSIAGSEVRTWEDMVKKIKTVKGKETTFVVEREGERFEVALMPRNVETVDIFGRQVTVPRIGITPAQEIISVRHSAAESLYLGGAKIAETTKLIIQSIWAMASRRVSPKDAVAGPVGVFQLMKEAARVGISALAYLSAVISVCFGIFNILPIPALDGGHLAFLAVEKIRRRPISQKVQEIITQAGFTLLIALMLLVTYNDIMRRMFDR